MLVLLVKRGNNSSDHWFWVPLVNCLRKVPITHYKPAPSGGADDILQLEHTGIYKIQILSEQQIPSELIDVINSIYLLHGHDTLSLGESVIQTAYEAFSKLTPLFTICSTGRIIHNNSDISQYNITGWADDANLNNVLIFGKLNVYNVSSVNSVTQVGLLSIPKDTKEVRLININKLEANNRTIYDYNELINLSIQNTVGTNFYTPNTLNLHLYIGDIISLKVTQRATYIINAKTKNITRHIYPPTTHGYGDTLMPMNKNNIIGKILDNFVVPYRAQNDSNQLFYDVL